MGPRWNDIIVVVGESEKRQLKFIFVDTISENDTKQDTISTFNILESLCVRVKTRLPSLKSVTIVTDNANNYAKGTSHLISYYRLENQGFRLTNVLNPDSQSSKNMWTHTLVFVRVRLTSL